MKTTIQILGTGCAKCTQLADNAAEAVERLGIECEIEKVTDINRIMDFGVMITPGLVVNGDVKAVGKVLSPAAITELLG